MLENNKIPLGLDDNVGATTTCMNRRSWLAARRPVNEHCLTNLEVLHRSGVVGLSSVEGAFFDVMEEIEDVLLETHGTVGKIS